MLITISCSLVVLVIGSYALMQWAGNKPFSIPGGIAALLGITGICSSVLLAIFMSIITFEWYASEYKASIINNEYGTNYTQEQIFYASDVINTIREIQRNRNEVTLNVNTNKKEKTCLLLS